MPETHVPQTANLTNMTNLTNTSAPLPVQTAQVPPTQQAAQQPAGQPIPQQQATTPPETPQTPQQQTAGETTAPPSWLKARLDEERRKAEERARQKAEQEFREKHAAALKLAEALQKQGYDPAYVASQYEQMMREAQAQQVGLPPQAFEQLQQVQSGFQALMEQQRALQKQLHDRDLNNLLLTAENQVLSSDPLAPKYVEVIRQRMALWASRYADTLDALPTLDELVTEGIAAFRMAAWDEVQKRQQAQAMQAALVNQQYRQEHQALVPTTAVQPQLPAVDLRSLAISKDPKDQALFEEYVRAAKSGDKGLIQTVMAKLGLSSGA